MNAAVLADRRLLDRIHLALEPGEFGGGLLVAADERRRPEDDAPTVVAIASFVRCLSCAPAAIAVTAKSRLAQAPKILTVDEAGLPGFYVSNWGGLWAPKGTPRNVTAKLNVAVVDALADPALAMETAEDPVKFLRDNKQSKGGPQLITMVKPVVSNKKAFEGPADACSPQSDCEKANRDLMTGEPGQPR